MQQTPRGIRRIEGTDLHKLAADLPGLANEVDAAIGAAVVEARYPAPTIGSGADANTLTEPRAYVALGSIANAPADWTGPSAVIETFELAAGAGVSLHQRFTDWQTGATWTRVRSGVTGTWGPYSRTDGISRGATTLTTGDATTQPAGAYFLPAGNTVTGLPRGVTTGRLTRAPRLDTFHTLGAVASVYERRQGTSGLWGGWVRVVAEQATPLSLTRPLAATTETVSSRSVRIPFAVPALARRWRVVIRNANYRTNTVYGGSCTIRTVTLGLGKRDEQGKLTSSFGPWKRVLVRDAAVQDLGGGYATPWQTDDLHPGTDYLLSFGYQHNGIETHLGMGGGWQTSFNAMNAELDNDPTAAKATRLPFDVQIEMVTDANDLPTDIYLGDSISAGSNATFPVHEAPGAIASRNARRQARLHTYGGAALGEWIGPNWGDATSLKWQHVAEHGRADRAFIALGNNDIHAGTDLSTLQANFRSLLTLVQERVSSTVIACTVTPRTAWTGTAKETLRQAFNDWLRTYPEGITGVADLARSVEDAAGTAPRADYVTSDGIHFNTAGSTALAAALRRL